MSQCSVDAKSIELIKAELEALTFDTPPAETTAVTSGDKTENLLNQFFNSGSSDGNIDDIRRISSQSYSSDLLNDVFKRVTDQASVSTQETANQQTANQAFADMFSTGSGQGQPFQQAKPEATKQPDAFNPFEISGQQRQFMTHSSNAAFAAATPQINTQMLSS